MRAPRSGRAPGTPRPSVMSQPPVRQVAIVVGTRPEAIKMAPVYEALRRRNTLAPLLVSTAQHREMLRQTLDVFGMVPDVDLGLMQNGQDLGVFTARAMTALTDLFRATRPDFLLVQGDTSTVTAAVLSAFYQGIPIGHVEAGLRSFDLASPFPEEVNRRVASCMATVHFAPTEEARENLAAEGIPEGDIVVCGNTVVDAIHMVPRLPRFATPGLDRVDWEGHRILLVTVHRRESQGAQLEGICDALEQIVAAHPEVALCFPVHLNPRVREVVFRRLARTPRVHLFDPLPYPELLEVLRRSTLVLSDSGGIQEEVPTLRKPILILRDVTERPEVVRAGFGELVGTDPATILQRASRLLGDPGLYRARVGGANPFGDGRAAERIADAVEARLPGGARPPLRLGGEALRTTIARLREVA